MPPPQQQPPRTHHAFAGEGASSGNVPASSPAASHSDFPWRFADIVQPFPEVSKTSMRRQMKSLTRDSGQMAAAEFTLPCSHELQLGNIFRGTSELVTDHR